MKTNNESLLPLAESITDSQFRAIPELEQRYGAVGRMRCLEDNRFHLSYLEESAALRDSSIFLHYVEWAKTMLASRGVEPEDLRANLNTIRTVIAESDLELAGEAIRVVQHAIENFDSLGEEPVSFLEAASPLASQYLELLLEGRQREAATLVVDAADQGAEIQAIYVDLFEPVQREVGRLWQLNRISVAQEHFCTSATQSVMARLYPRFVGASPTRGTVLAACVGPELHEVGLRMVTDLLELDGWDTSYLGSNMPVSGLISMLRERRPDLLTLSATISGNLGHAAELIEKIRMEPEIRDIPILIGGYPFRVSRDLTRLIGADGTAESASVAVIEAERIADGR